MRRKPVPSTRRQSAAFGGSHNGRRAWRAAPLGFVVLHLEWIAYGLAVFSFCYYSALFYRVLLDFVFTILQKMLRYF